VRAGGILNLYGFISGDLHVLSGAVAVIHGTVTGFVQNAGASVRIHGTVGSVRDIYDRRRDEASLDEVERIVP
jgi:hypothetical protein